MITLSALSPRQREIAELVADGLSYPTIAARLANLRSFRHQTISPRTVVMHVAAIAELLGDDGTTPKFRVQRWVQRQRA